MNNPEQRLAEPVSGSRRFLNFIIDLTVWGSILWVLDLFFDLNVQNNRGIFSLFSASFLIYYFVMEAVFQRTPGKFVTKTIVVNESGGKPKLSFIFFRTLCRLIPFDHISFLFVRKGFHDYLSNTTVVDASEVPDIKKLKDQS